MYRQYSMGKTKTEAKTKNLYIPELTNIFLSLYNNCLQSIYFAASISNNLKVI